MKIKSLLYIVFFCTISVQAQRKSVLKAVEDVVGYNQIPSENVFIHYNTTLLFAGEYLYYNLYCLNAKNNLLSAISKIAYVKLIDDEGQSVFEHKIKLENGLGQGDFFIPVSIPSGNYKLIGYTQWMLNARKAGFFRGDVSIINPYQGDQGKILETNLRKEASDKYAQDNIISTNNFETRKDNSTIFIKDTVYSKRSRVQFNIQKSEVQDGNYSISVRKMDTFKKAKPTTTTDFFELDSTSAVNASGAIGDSIFLPEMRGELIYGRIISNDSSFSVSQLDVGLSVSGKINDIKMVSTDDKGNFIMCLDQHHNEDKIMIEVQDVDKTKYTILTDNIPETDLGSLDFYSFKIEQTSLDEIIKRSVYNQIENSFYNLKPDTIQDRAIVSSFYGKDYVNYDLDEYTRFSTMKETIVEVVEGVRIRKNKRGKEVFSIYKDYVGGSKSNYLPLVLVDGGIVQDHEDIINYDVREIGNIRFIKDRYYIGTKVFEGILEIKTLKENYWEQLERKGSIQFNDLKLLEKKRYYKQAYDKSNKDNRIPDYRHQLLWSPNVEISGEGVALDFYTSDVAGDFEITLQGFTKKGKAVSITQHFKVK
ncbi:hypothetical protein [Aquimarina mytili]|uniref:TonB-dependent receptor n=1 Tax=Aquimarina mytili TaxID=874423 RepID=A0A936ZS72_9FLAO|nr:hypothetical protein [Aquimarina mytili]MBL0684452.1 hypothetical protein [Aquimarina mytili]